MENVDIESIWRAVKKTKSGIMQDQLCLSNKYQAVVITENVESVQKFLGIQSSDDVSKRMTNETLEVAAKMFWYLNSCTAESKPWVQFYTNIFQNFPPDQIVLTFNRILKKKSTRQNEKIRATAMTLFQNLTSVLELNYKEIQNMVNGKKNLSLNRGIDACIYCFH